MKNPFRKISDFILISIMFVGLFFIGIYEEFRDRLWEMTHYGKLNEPLRRSDYL